MHKPVNQNSDFLSKQPRFLPFLIVLAVCVLSYFNCFTHGFLIDDYTHLVGEITLNDVSIDGLYLEGYKEFYRPFAFMFLKMALAVFGQSAFLYHCYNFFLFYVLCLLFYRILLALKSSVLFSLLTVCFYAAHPINNFLLNYKTAGNNTIFMICAQLVFLFYLYFLENEKKNAGWFLASLVVFFLSLLSHEINFMLPVYIFIAGYFLQKVSFKKNLQYTALYAIPFLFYLFIRSQVLEKQPISHFLDASMPGAQYLKVMIKLVSWYASKLIYPRDIIFIWDERIASVSLNVFEILGGILVAAALGGIVVKRWKGIYPFAFVLFWSGLLPLFLAGVTYSKQFQTAIIEPHWFGFSSIGFFILFAGVLVRVDRMLGRQVTFVTVMMVIFLLTAITRNGNFHWKSERSYCEYWLQVNSLNGTAWNCWANANIIEKNRGLNPQSYSTCNDPSFVAFSFHIQSDANTALQFYRTALAKDPQCLFAHYGLALLFADLKDRETSAQFMQKALSLNKNYYPLYVEVEKVFNNTHDSKAARRAQKMFEEAHVQSKGF
jgi:hypothetical protein